MRGIFIEVPSSRYFSLSSSYPLDLSGVGDPAGSNATASLPLRVTGTHKPIHHDKVEIPYIMKRKRRVKFISVKASSLQIRRIRIPNMGR